MVPLTNYREFGNQSLDYINTKLCPAAPSVAFKLSRHDYLTEMWYPCVCCHCWYNNVFRKCQHSETELESQIFLLTTFFFLLMSGAPLRLLLILVFTSGTVHLVCALLMHCTF